MIDATPIATDRSRVIAPTAGVDLWWSGKHHHGANIQVITAPTPWPIYTCPVRPGREHFRDVRACSPRPAGELDAWRAGGGVVLADLGYQGERTRMIVPVKKRGTTLSIDQSCFNALHAPTPALAERGNALLKVTFTALRHVTTSPNASAR